jgi:hypothetical protein
MFCKFTHGAVLISVLYKKLLNFHQLTIADVSYHVNFRQSRSRQIHYHFLSNFQFDKIDKN